MKTTAFLPLFLFIPFLFLVNSRSAKEKHPGKSPEEAIGLVKRRDNPDTCIAVPSAFTPNNDGKNDKIGPIENGCRIRFLLFRIYNRAGQVIFESEYIGQDWDGTVKGVPQEAGFYPYICYYTAVGGTSQWFNGTITLIR